MGRLNVTEAAVEFSAKAPKQVGRYVPVVVFGRNASLNVSFEDGGKLMPVEGDGIPLNIGGSGGSAADWARYMNANPGAQ